MAIATASKADLAGRDFLDFGGYTQTDLEDLLRLSLDLKARRKRGETTPYLTGKTLALIFEKPSTRTRVSFEVGMFELGGHALYLPDSGTQMGRGEPIPDTARVLSRYVQGIMIRTFSHQAVQELAQYATVPVINGLTDDHHPCQALADLLTILEHKGTLKGLTLAYLGDGNNMAHSLIEAGALAGMTVKVATPEGFEPRADIVAQAMKVGGRGSIRVVKDPAEAVAGADVVYTDVWASMGQEQESAQRKQVFAPYRVSEEQFAAADKDAVFMHCLPAHRGEEVDAGVIDGPRSIVFDQAENRLHAQKAVLVATMG